MTARLHLPDLRPAAPVRPPWTYGDTIARIGEWVVTIAALAVAPGLFALAAWVAVPAWFPAVAALPERDRHALQLMVAAPVFCTAAAIAYCVLHALSGKDTHR